METLTRVAAKEFAPRGITLDAVAPGLVTSEMFAKGKTADQLAAIERAAPGGRLGEIDEIMLDVHGTVVERLDAPAQDAGVEEDTGEEEAVAGPIAIAVDVNETEAGAAS